MINNYQEAFGVLGLLPGASFDDCKRAYRNAVKAYHPDNNDSNISSKYYLYSEAYQYLENLYNMNSWPVIVYSDRIKTRTNGSFTPGAGRIIGTPIMKDDESDKQKNAEKLYREKLLKKQNDKAKKQAEDNKKMAEMQRKAKEAEELLDEIKWMRVAGIIHDTIAEDNKNRDIDDRLKKAFAQHDKNIMNDKYRKSDDV